MSQSHLFNSCEGEGGRAVKREIRLFLGVRGGRGREDPTQWSLRKQVQNARMNEQRVHTCDMLSTQKSCLPFVCLGNSSADRVRRLLGKGSQGPEARSRASPLLPKCPGAASTLTGTNHFLPACLLPAWEPPRLGLPLPDPCAHTEAQAWV